MTKLLNIFADLEKIREKRKESLALMQTPNQKTESYAMVGHTSNECEEDQKKKMEYEIENFLQINKRSLLYSLALTTWLIEKIALTTRSVQLAVAGSWC